MQTTPRRAHLHPSVGSSGRAENGAEFIAHCDDNVNFKAKNVKRRCAPNRSERAGRGMKNAFVRRTLGERNFCKRYRKSCIAYSAAENACPSAGRRGRFLRLEGRNFGRFNEKAQARAGLRNKLSKY